MKVSWAARICIARSSRTVVSLSLSLHARAEKGTGKEDKRSGSAVSKDCLFNAMLFRLVTAHYARLVEYEGSVEFVRFYRCIFKPSLFFPLSLFFFSIIFLRGGRAKWFEKLWIKASIKFASDRHLRRNRNIWPTVANEMAEREMLWKRSGRATIPTDAPCTFFLYECELIWNSKARRFFVVGQKVTCAWLFVSSKRQGYRKFSSVFYLSGITWFIVEQVRWCDLMTLLFLILRVKNKNLNWEI